MGKSNPKCKGSQFERDIAKKLSLWVSNGERDDIFWRTASSGGRFTQNKNKTLANSAGDVSYLDEIGKPLLDRFIIECKVGYNKTRVLDILFKKNEITKWLDTLQEEMNRTGHKEFMLIWKINFLGTVVIINERTFKQIKQTDRWIAFTHNNQVYYISQLDDFLISHLIK